MATACTYCGQDLPRDDAHFCNNCGMLVPSHPFSSQSLSAANSATLAPHVEPEKPTSREQMVHQQTEKPVLREQMVQQPRPRTTRRIAPENLSASSIAWPAPITHVSVKDVRTQKEDEYVAPQESQPVQSSSPHSAPAERELRVKVWEQELHNPPTPLPASIIEVEEGDIEDAPTSPLETPEQRTIGNPSSQHGSDTPRDDVEHLDTVPMPNYAQKPQQASPLSHSIHGNTLFACSSCYPATTKPSKLHEHSHTLFEYIATANGSISISSIFTCAQKSGFLCASNTREACPCCLDF